MISNREYTLAGVAAIALILLFPTYWLAMMFSGAFDSGEGFYQSVVEFSPSDLVFLLIGVLTVYVYLSLKRFFNDRFGFSGANLPINILIGATAIYVFGLVGLDILMSLAGDQLGLETHKFVLGANLVVGTGGMIVFGVADILLGVMLLKLSDVNAPLLRAFSVVAIIQGIVEISIIFSAAIILIFPLSLLLITLLFLQKPTMLDVV